MHDTRTLLIPVTLLYERSSRAFASGETRIANSYTTKRRNTIYLTFTLDNHLTYISGNLRNGFNLYAVFDFAPHLSLFLHWNTQ